MSSATLFRLSGLALLIALPLQVLGFVLHPPSEEVVDVLKPAYGPAHLILFVSWMFALLGLTGFYARQSHRAGVLGLIGFAATVFAAAYHFYLLLYEAYATPLLAQDPTTQPLLGDGPLAHGAGARGYLLKGADRDETLAAIRAVARGEAVFGPGIARRLTRYFSEGSPASKTIRAPRDVFPELTDREREILALIAAGKNNAEISQTLFLSLKTVRNYVSNIFAKLQVADRAQAIVRARDAGLGGDTGEEPSVS